MKGEEPQWTWEQYYFVLKGDLGLEPNWDIPAHLSPVQIHELVYVVMTAADSAQAEGATEILCEDPLAAPWVMGILEHAATKTTRHHQRILFLIRRAGLMDPTNRHALIEQRGTDPDPGAAYWQKLAQRGVQLYDRLVVEEG